VSETVTALDGRHGAVRGDDVPAVVSAAGSYTYQVHLQRRTGPLRRWRGRVVTVDGNGRRRHWPWRSARSREKLVGVLWEETMRDIQWRTGGASVKIVEVNA
jgi:hypothetical protein